jgi:HAD superfamily hydrolase (TIGR01509 family)
MNIIIPLGGKGERFSKNGYNQPKPLIQILDKCMIEYVLDNITLLEDDKIFIIYNSSLDKYNFSKYIHNKYPSIQLIEINDTKGACETLFLGIQNILDNYHYNNKCLILDCDTFYTDDIINIFKKSNDNMVFYTKNYDTNAIYSYIELNDELIITNIQEKNKISDNANTGAYAFTDIMVLFDHCKYILDNNIHFNNEPYTSCVISEMIKKSIIFKGYELMENRVFSLGTPMSVNKYIDNTYAFLFDLDGTLVLTDEIYYNVWDEILMKYNIILTKEIFSDFIQGNNDIYVLNSLLKNINIDVKELSALKDKLFIENIDKIKLNGDIYNSIKQIKLSGYKICIVTNCNKIVANKIINYININKLIDFIISNDDCINGKPNSEPYENAIKKYNIDNKKCFIFEDSKSGILSGKSVNSKLLIGIETIYNETELKKFDINFSIKNFDNFDINILINYKSDNNMHILNMIKINSSIEDIKNILIDDTKLKGGFISDVISFKIISNYNSVYSQILKYENNSNNNNLSIMAKNLDLYEREYYFYTDISNKINIKIPKFYNLIVDNNVNIGIVLENLLEKNYKLNINLNMNNIDISLKIIDRMTRMHSKFWNKDLKKMFPKLKYSTDTTFYPFLQEFINERYDLFKKKWSNNLNQKQINKWDEIFNDFSNIQKRFSVGNNLTFIHGDIKSPNIFYDSENDHEPYFIDWQHCAIGKGVQDLIFFIIESFSIVNIKIIFNLLKYYYYQKLIEYGITNYSFIEYENDIRDALYYIPFFTCIWFGTVPQDELIDKNFPYFLINKLVYVIDFNE